MRRVTPIFGPTIPSTTVDVAGHRVLPAATHTHTHGGRGRARGRGEAGQPQRARGGGARHHVSQGASVVCVAVAAWWCARARRERGRRGCRSTQTNRPRGAQPGRGRRRRALVAPCPRQAAAAATNGQRTRARTLGATPATGAPAKQVVLRNKKAKAAQLTRGGGRTLRPGHPHHHGGQQDTGRAKQKVHVADGRARHRVVSLRTSYA